MSLESMNDSVRQSLDAVAIVGAGLTLAQVLPPIAAALSILWLLFQIFDRIKYGPRRGRE